MPRMAIPLKNGMKDDWREFAKSLAGDRRKDFDDFNRRYGLTTHSAWLEELPDGTDIVLVEVDGPGASSFFGKLANSNEGFDRWFRERISTAHGIDFSKPQELRPAEQMIGEGAPA